MANADEGIPDERMGVVSADDDPTSAWCGADDQDGVCGGLHADGDRCGGDGGGDGSDASSSWQQLRQPQLRPAG